jgi:hypothetical protein
MRIHGNFWLEALLDGVNADIHSNDVLRTDGNSFLVEGMGTYTVDERVGQPGNFQPPNDWNGPDTSNVFQRPYIPIPVWDHVAFATEAQTNGYYTTTDLTVDGDILTANGITTIDQYAEQMLLMPPGDYGTEENPFLIMVGDSTAELRFVNNVQLSGYFQFGSLGDIEIDPQGNPGGLMFDYTADIANEEAYTHVGLFTTKGVRVQANAEIHATMYAGGPMVFLGTTTIIGGLIADEATFQGGGDIHVRWAGVGGSVEEYFEGYDEPIGPVIIAYAEW